jgi:hypothetical protein
VVSPNPPSPFPAMAYCTTFCAPFRPHPSPPRARGGSFGSSPVHGGGQEGGELRVHSCGLCLHPSPPRGRGGRCGPSPVHGGGQEGGNVRLTFRLPEAAWMRITHPQSRRSCARGYRSRTGSPRHRRPGQHRGSSCCRRAWSQTPPPAGRSRTASPRCPRRCRRW